MSVPEVPDTRGGEGEMGYEADQNNAAVDPHGRSLGAENRGEIRDALWAESEGEAGEMGEARRPLSRRQVEQRLGEYFVGWTETPRGPAVVAACFWDDVVRRLDHYFSSEVEVVGPFHHQVGSSGPPDGLIYRLPIDA